jgi:hypothetical protein
MDGDYDEEMLLANETFGFFRRAADDTDEEVGRIAREWLDETAASFPWLADAPDLSEVRGVRLIHTYDGSIWKRFVETLGDASPKQLVVLSPFHDANGEMMHRIRKQWPRCKIEFLVQQGYTNLPIAEIKKSRSWIELAEVENQKRRLHAKLLAWESADQQGCLVGSANFTAAAFDGRNVEACLLVADTNGRVSALFDKELRKRKIKFADFEPGTEEEPEPETTQIPGLRISSAVLLASGQLRVSYAHNLDEEPTALRVAVRGRGEQRPRASMKVSNQKKATETVTLPESALADSHATLLASLIVELPSGRLESMPVWIVQEDRLTYEPGDGSSGTQRKIEDTGEGLLDFLDDLGRREGMSAVIDYLRRLNIRFQDGAGGLRGRRRFRLVIRDPFQADTAPEWLIIAKTQSDDLEAAIYDFVDRHEKGCLRRHAARGNINGMDNFVDIFTTIIKLLYTNYLRSVVKRGRLIGYVTSLIEIATSGDQEKNDPTDGYLFLAAITKFCRKPATRQTSWVKSVPLC